MKTPAIALFALCLSTLSCWAAEPVAASDGRVLGTAHFEIDLDSNSLIVTTDEETNETIGKIIAELDQAVPQALIKILFLEVQHGDDLDLGTDISYSHESSNGDKSILNTMFGAASFLEGGTATILKNDLEVTLSALAEVTRMEVLSRPSIMARNNEEATITIGSEVPFIRNTQVTDDGRVLNTIEYEDIGIILTVTPHITEDGMVELDVAPEISTLTSESVKISETVVAPTYAKRSAKTRVLVPSGRTVVIGGLMDTQETEVVRKIPLLGDIWVIGALFRRTIKTKSKTELLIFLTPTVVTSGAQAAELGRQERQAAQTLEKAFRKDQAKKETGDR